MTGDKPWFEKILVLVPMDGRYGQCDTGQTAAEIRRLLGDGAAPRVEVEEVRKGDNFCGTLNHGLSRMLHEGIDLVTILSAEAGEYLNEDIALHTLAAFGSGAKVVGIAIEELEESIRKGRVANTFATWDARALVAAGCFDLLAAQVADGGEEENRLAGVEEIIPLLRLADAHGQCITIIVPPPASWTASRAQPGSEEEAEQARKLNSKLLRQTLRAQQVGRKLSELEDAILQIIDRR